MPDPLIPTRYDALRHKTCGVAARITYDTVKRYYADGYAPCANCGHRRFPTHEYELLFVPMEEPTP